MKLPRKWLMIAVMAIVLTGDLAIGGYYLLNKNLSARFERQLAAQGFTDIAMHGFKTYYDGVVIQSLHLGDRFDFGKIYIQGKPWQIWRNRPEHIRIYTASLMPEKWLGGRLGWPFPAATALTVDNFDFHLSVLGIDTTFNGSARQSLPGRLTADFNSTTARLKSRGHAEIKVSHATVTRIDTMIDDAALNFASLTARRCGGWINLDYTKDIWSISAELTTGYLLIDKEPLLDAVARSSGNVLQPVWNMTGREQADPAVWSFDLKEGGLTVHRGEQSAFMRWQKLDDAVLGDVAILMQSLKDPAEEEPPMPE